MNYDTLLINADSQGSFIYRRTKKNRNITYIMRLIL